VLVGRIRRLVCLSWRRCELTLVLIVTVGRCFSEW
jgi:hypothetical protein